MESRSAWSCLNLCSIYYYLFLWKWLDVFGLIFYCLSDLWSFLLTGFLSLRLRDMCICTSWQKCHSAIAGDNQFPTEEEGDGLLELSKSSALSGPLPFAAPVDGIEHRGGGQSSMAPGGARIAAAGVRAGDVRTVTPCILAYSFLLCLSPMSLGEYSRWSLPTFACFLCLIISACGEL